jgi:hypothetical protein
MIDRKRLRPSRPAAAPTPALTDEQETNTSSQFGRSPKFLCSPEE